MEETGTLLVRVYTSQAQIPVEGTTVAVTGREQEGKRELISLQVTDSSGTIRPVRIPTPAAIDSTQPDPPEGTVPFASCDVWAEHPGFAALRMEGVQVFSGVETLQNMELVPLIQGESSLDRQGSNVTTPQNL